MPNPKPLAEWAAQCPSLLERLEADHKGLIDSIDRLIELSEVYDISTPDFAILGNTLRWRPLAEAGLRALSEAQTKLQTFSGIAHTTVAAGDAYHLDDVDKALSALEKLVNRSHNASAPAGKNALHAWAQKHLDAVMGCVGQVPGAGEAGTVILVPDTNAVLFQPRWDLWAAATGDATIAILPTVLRELDRQKVSGNAEVKRKAELEGNILVELQRRGDIIAGVPVADHLRLRMEAVEPDMGATLPWLRADVADDQLIATVLEVAARHPSCRVLLVTRDMLLQSKATNAGICWTRPDDLAIPAEPAPVKMPPAPKLVLQFDPGSLQSAATTQESYEKRQTLQVVNLSEFPVYLRTLVLQGGGFLNFVPAVLQGLSTKEFAVTFLMASGSVLQISLVALRADGSGEPVVFNGEFVYGANGLQEWGS